MKTLIAAIAALTLLSTINANAGEVDVFVKAGYFGWHEKTASRPDFVAENGVAIEPGISYTARPIPYVALSAAASLKLVGSTYSGTAQWDGTGEMSGGRANLSLKGELKATGEIPVGGLTIGPVVGVQAEELFRFAIKERWDIISAKTGVKGSYGPVAVEMGLTKPIYTVNNWDVYGTETISAPTVDLQPKGKVSPYAEIRVKAGAGKTISFVFEETRWSESDVVVAPTTVAIGSGVFQTTTGFLQPETVTRFIGVQFDWKF